jgi:hypothetical protein
MSTRRYTHHEALVSADWVAELLNDLKTASLRATKIAESILGTQSPETLEPRCFVTG